MDPGEQTPVTPDSLYTVSIGGEIEEREEQDLDSSDSDASGLYNSNNLAGILEDNETRTSEATITRKPEANEKRLSGNIGSTMSHSPPSNLTSGTASWVQKNIFSKL